MHSYILQEVTVVEPGSECYRANLWLEGNIIKAVTRPDDSAGQGQISDKTTIINCRGLYAIPGFIELHTHINSPNNQKALASLNSYVETVYQHTYDYLKCGITTIRDLGGVTDFLIQLRQQATISSPKTRPLPRFVVAGPVLTAPDGHPAGTQFRTNNFLRQRAARELLDPQTASYEVRKLKAAGVDLIKVVFTQCLLHDHCQQTKTVPQLRPQVFKAIVDTAHSCGLTVTTHTVTAQDVYEAVLAGSNGIEHGIVMDGPNNYDDCLIEMLVRKKISYVPTLTAIEAMAPQYLEQAVSNVQRLWKAGVKIGVGSDAGNPGVLFGNGFLRELELLQTAGLPPNEVLKMATQVAAAEIKQSEQLGMIKSGYQADLVLLDSDPTQSLQGLDQQIRLVFRAGVPVYSKLNSNVPKTFSLAL